VRTTLAFHYGIHEELPWHWERAYLEALPRLLGMDEGEPVEELDLPDELPPAALALVGEGAPAPAARAPASDLDDLGEMGLTVRQV
jgi:hypothetical protein